MSEIIIELLHNKTTNQMIDGYSVSAAANRHGYQVVAGENNSTTITVHYPTDYSTGHQVVYMKNARGEYVNAILTSQANIERQKLKTPLGLTRLDTTREVDVNSYSFTLPSSMTFAGNTFLVFINLANDEQGNDTKTVWQPVVVPILSTGVDYKKVAQASPDILEDAIRAIESVRKLLQPPDAIENGSVLGVSISKEKGNFVFENMSKLSPYVQDDNWWINGVDTGVKASAVGIEDISETDRQDESGTSNPKGLYVVYTITYSDKHTQTFVVKDGELNELQAHLLDEANAFAKTANANSETARQLAQSVRDDADSGKFNGRDGNDGISIPADSGMYRLEIRDDGNLYVITSEQDTVQPPLRIDDSGNLILTI